MEEIPEWLTDEFLSRALNSREGNKYKVTSSVIGRATAPGDNYASDIYRATVQVELDGEEDCLSVIIKAELANNEMSKLVTEGNAFQREIDAFTIGLPALELILKALPQKCKPYAAKCYYTHSGPPASVLVFEDLKLKGFRLVDKATELDINHCLIAVRRLATYQAASVVLSRTEPNKIEPFKETMFNENMREGMQKIIQPIIKALAKEAENWPECDRSIPNKLRDLVPVAYDILMECVKRDDEAFNILAHEDIWINNMMFQYSEDTKEVTDIRLVDLQLYHWTSPAVDLLHIINASSTAEVVEKQHIVIDEYYKTLKETLTALGYPHLCPSKSYLYEEIDKRSKFGMIMGLIVRTVIFADRDKIPDIEKIIYSDGEIHLTQAYKESIRKLLPLFHEKDWL